MSRCCTQDGGCGLDTPLSSECLPLGAPGNIDLACPDFELPAGLTWAGCCTAGGRCGAFGVSAGLGCIDNAALGAPEASCAYESSNTCQAILVVTCDGSEDCPAGHQCCGEWNSAYRRLLCIEGTCPQAQATASAVWSEICHPGDTCTQRGFECRRAPTLPYGIYRCRDTGEPAVGRVSTARDELNCGSVVCGAGQTCCVPEPGEPHCVSAGEPCRCTPMPPTDARDAGPDEDAG